ncbi:MAG: glycosyltransferase [Planctomycetes bacterium]|nr:glycosyltransferase [Planctomycetota bacterium]
MNRASTSLSQRPRIKVAYILHRFPYLTETFIMREMHSLRDNNVDLHIFSLLSPIHNIVHKEAKELAPLARYSPFVSLEIVLALLFFLIWSPIRFARSFVKTIRQTWREPRLLLRTLVLFPKTVFYARQMQRLEVQHIHAHFVWLEGIAAGIVSELTGVTFSIHPHAFGLFSRDQQDVRVELENATKIVTVSRYHQDYIENLCPRIRAGDIQIVHYGVDTQLFRPLRNPLKNNPPRILSVGRLVEKKGHKYLVDACALLKQRGVAFQCEIVGSGKKERKELQTRIDNHGLADCVTLLGAQGQEEILKLCQTSDVLALACIRARDGDQDGMPNVLIEAMACGLPVVTTRIAGIPEIVKDGYNGRLALDRDVGSLADGIEDLIQDEYARLEFGRRARETVVQHFEIKSNAARLAHVFRSIVYHTEIDEDSAAESIESRELVDSVSEGE